LFWYGSMKFCLYCIVQKWKNKKSLKIVVFAKFSHNA
jgi:hypothetical protein